jgi:hypothetical protein
MNNSCTASAIAAPQGACQSIPIHSCAVIKQGHTFQPFFLTSTGPRKPDVIFIVGNIHLEYYRVEAEFTAEDRASTIFMQCIGGLLGEPINIEMNQISSQLRLEII